MSDKKVLEISDVFLVAFLTICGLSFSLEKRNSRVFFCFNISDELYSALSKFNVGAQVDVQSYSREVKRIKSIMFEAKNNKGETENDG